MTSVNLTCTPASGKLNFSWSFLPSDPAYTDIADITLTVTDKKVSAENDSLIFTNYTISPYVINPITEVKTLNKSYVLSGIPLGTEINAILTITKTNQSSFTSNSITKRFMQEPVAPVMEITTTDNKISHKISNISHLHPTDGFSKLTHIQILYSKGEDNGITSSILAIGPSSEYLLKRDLLGLDNNTEYELTFRVKNEIGWSQNSQTYIAVPSNKPNPISYLFANSGIDNANKGRDPSTNFVSSTNVDLQFPRPDDYDELILQKLAITSFTIQRYILDASGIKIQSSLFSKVIHVDPSLNSVPNDSLWVLDPSRQVIKYSDVDVPVGFNYMYGVLATNKFGSSEAAECLVRHADLPSAPTINKIEPSNNAVTVNLSKPLLLNGFADVSNTLYTYSIAVNEVSGNTLVYRGYKNSTVDGSGNMTISTFTGGALQNGKQYEFNARIIVDISQNTISGSTVSQDSVKNTYYSVRSAGVRSRPFTLPSKPTGLVCSPLDNSLNFLDPSSQPLDNKVWVRWNTVSASNNGGIDGDGVIKYKIYVNGIEDYTNIAQLNNSQSNFLISGNGNGSQMQVEVYSYVYNSELQKEILSVASDAVMITPFKLPASISNLVLDASGANTLRFSFTGLNAIQAGGLPVQYERVLTNLSNNSVVSSITDTTTNGTYGSLTSGIMYKLTVTPTVSSKVSSDLTAPTRSFFGQSVSDSEVSYFTPAAVSDLTKLPSDKAIRVDWNKPAGTTTDASNNIYSNGVKITGYRVQISNSASGPWTTLGTTEPTVEYFIASNLTNGTTYFIRVYVVGVAGLNNVEGTESVVSSIPQLGPNPVSGLVAEPSNASIKFTWNAQGDNTPGVDGFSVYKNGELVSSTYFNSTTVVRTGQKWSWTDSNQLVNGTIYNYVFYAIRQVVSGDPLSSLISPQTSIDAAPYTGASEPRTVSYTTTSNTATVKWSQPLVLGGAGVGQNSSLIYTLSLFDFSGNGTPSNSASDYVKLIEPVKETSNLTETVSGLVTNKTYRIVLGSYYTDANNNKVNGATVQLFPVKPNNPPLNVSDLIAEAGDDQVTLKWTLPTDASDALAYSRDSIKIYRSILTAGGVVGARVLYADLPTTATQFVDKSGVLLSGTFRATGSMNGNARLYSGLTDSSNLPAATILNGNQYTYEVVLNVSTLDVEQPAAVVAANIIPSGKVLVRTALAQDSTDKKTFSITLNKNGSDLRDFLVVGLLGDGSGNLPLPVYKGEFIQPSYFGTVNSNGSTPATADTFAANQFFNWVFTLDNVPKDILLVVENGNGFTLRSWPTNGSLSGLSA